MRDSGEGDIAVLSLAGEPPIGARGLRAAIVWELWGQEVRAIGYPVGIPPAEWASARVRGHVSPHWMQLDHPESFGARIRQGYSGGPLWHAGVQAVVGMVVAEEPDPQLRMAYMIPATVLRGACQHLSVAFSTQGIGKGQGTYFAQQPDVQDLQGLRAAGSLVRPSNEATRIERQLMELRRLEPLLHPDVVKDIQRRLLAPYFQDWE